MSARTTFRLLSGGVSLEIGGTPEFVRDNLRPFLPFVQRVAGESAIESPEEGAEKPQRDLPAWYEQHVAPGMRLTMQDSILVFALWMRSFKKFVFTANDIRHAFAEVGQQAPKSLLQLLGTLKRDHKLILGTDRRGEYMLNTTGIERARRTVGLPPKRGSESAGGGGGRG